MLSSEIAWLEQLFETHSANVTSFFREEVAKLHQRLDVAHDKLNTVIVAASHIIEGNATMAADHASILADLKAFEADLDAKVDAAVTEFQSFEASHSAQTESLSDIAEIVARLPGITSKLDAIKEPKDGPVAAGGSQAGSGSDAGQTSSSDHVTEVGPTSTTALAQDGSLTTLDHATGSASTIDPLGTPVATDEAAVQAARDAASAAGVSIPSS